MKTRVVQFTENNARILVVQDATPYEGLANTAINPDLTGVAGVPPHLWKLENGRVMPMTEAERLLRLQDHSIRGVINDGLPPPKPHLVRRFWAKYGRLVLAFALGAGLGLVL